MTSTLLEIRLRQSIWICSKKNNPAKFRPDPIWNDGALSFFLRGRPNNTKKNKMRSEMTYTVSGGGLGLNSTQSNA